MRYLFTLSFLLFLTIVTAACQSQPQPLRLLTRPTPPTRPIPLTRRNHRRLVIALEFHPRR